LHVTRFVGRGLRHLARRAGELRRPDHFPIAYKLALAIAVVIAVGMTVLGTVILDHQTRLLRQQMNELGSMVVRQMAEGVKEPLLANDTLALQLAAGNMLTHPGVLGAAVYADDGTPLIEKGTPLSDAHFTNLRHRLSRDNNATQPSLAWARTTGGPALSFLAPLRLRELNLGYVALTFDHARMARAERDAVRAIVTATLLMVLLGTLTALLLGRRLTRPILHLMDGSRAISSGDHRFRFSEARNDELGTLMQALNTMNEGLLRKEQVEHTFSRYVPPKVARRLLDDLEAMRLGGRHLQASVLFADIVGFTRLSEQLSPQAVSQLLNDYFGCIDQAAQACHGHVDKFIGDCAMLVFGVPESDVDHRYQAVACGLLIQEWVQQRNAERQRQNLVPVEFRIGINSGAMLAGNMGSETRMDFTVVGDAVNLAARLSDAAAPGAVLISDSLHREVAQRIVARPGETLRLRGKQEPVTTWQVLNVAPEHRPLLDSRLQALRAAPCRKSA